VFYDCRTDADALRVLLTPANVGLGRRPSPSPSPSPNLDPNPNPNQAFFRIRNIVDVSAAVLVFKLLDPHPEPNPNPNPDPNPKPNQAFKLLDEGAAFYALHMVSNPKPDPHTLTLARAQNLTQIRARTLSR